MLRSIARKADAVGAYYEFGIDGREAPDAPCPSRQDFFEADRVKGCLDYLAASNECEQKISNSFSFQRKLL